MGEKIFFVSLAIVVGILFMAGGLVGTLLLEKFKEFYYHKYRINSHVRKATNKYLFLFCLGIGVFLYKTLIK